MSAPTSANAYVNATQLAKWPTFLPQLADSTLLEHIWAQPLETDTSPALVRARTTLRIDREIVLAIPGLDAVALMVAAGAGGTTVPAEIEIYPELFVRVTDIPLALRLKTDLFKTGAAHRHTAAWPAATIRTRPRQ